MSGRAPLFTDPGTIHGVSWSWWGRVLRRVLAPRVPQRTAEATMKALAGHPAGPVHAEDAIRRAMVKWCRWGVDHEPTIHYAQTRPIPVSLPPGHLPLSTDCSGSTTLYAKWAGAPDPNGLHYSGAGYTGTMAGHLRQVSQKNLKPGDLVIFGNPRTHHVAVVLKADPDPVLASHGFEGGPIRVTLSQEAGYHQGEGGFRFYSLL